VQGTFLERFKVTILLFLNTKMALSYGILKGISPATEGYPLMP
jgi:hypothetical protein